MNIPPQAFLQETWQIPSDLEMALILYTLLLAAPFTTDYLLFWFIISTGDKRRKPNPP